MYHLMIMKKTDKNEKAVINIKRTSHMFCYN